MNTYQSGTTVRIEVFFKDFEGSFVDPSVITFSLYDKRHKLISETTITVANKLAVGHYYYDLVSEEGEFSYEWMGMIDDVPSIIRTEIAFNFV